MPTMENIHIYELKRMDLKGATVIDGFPSVGLVSSIVANYIINALNLEQVAIMDSVYFPTVSLIRDGEPMNPVRIYAGSKEENKDKIVVFISEFQPPPNLIKVIAAAVIDWAEDQKCDLLLCPEGLIVDRDKDDETRSDIQVYGIGSTARTSSILTENTITVFEEGVITGVAGVLLNEGKKRDFSVISLLSEAHPDYPDARAAARVIETIDRILLHTELDAQPLYEEAERIELQLKSIHKQTATAKRPPSPVRPSMYG
ncbi:MAG: proteasome assembly chaperone family protein [Thermoplasmata archaeon]